VPAARNDTTHAPSSSCRRGRRAKRPTARQGSTWLCLLVGLAILAVTAADASAEPLCTNTWIGGAEGNWQEAANWSAGHAPTSTDVACIGTGKKVNAWGEANHAGVLEVAGTLQITGTSLEVSNTLEPSTVAHLETSGGVLTGAANVNVTDPSRATAARLR